MKVDVDVGSFFEANSAAGIAYAAFDENIKRIAVNAKELTVTDRLMCELIAINFALQALQHLQFSEKTRANAICVHISNPFVTAILNGEKPPPKGYGRWINCIQRRADFLQCTVSYKWAFEDDLQWVNDLARIVTRPNSRQSLEWALSR
ncbi:MAG: hypothetical protein RR058_08190 [Oscillospiraceae bacterium]